MKITPVFNAERTAADDACNPAAQYTCCYGSNPVCLAVAIASFLRDATVPAAEVRELAAAGLMPAAAAA